VGFDARGGDVAAGIMGWGGAVTALAAGGFNGLGIGAANQVTSAFMPSIGDGSAGYTQSVQPPSTAPKGGLGGRDGGAGASKNNMGGTKELAPPDTTVPDVYRSSAGQVACYPDCSTNPSANFPDTPAGIEQWRQYSDAYEIVANTILVADGLVNLGRFALRPAALRAWEWRSQSVTVRARGLMT